MIPSPSSHNNSISAKTSSFTLSDSLRKAHIQDTLSEYNFKHHRSIFTLILFKSSTVSEIKKKVQDHLKTTNDITLKYRKTQLEDGTLLLDYNINPEDFIHITIHKPAKIQIFIKGPKLTLIRTYKSSTVANLKHKLLKKTQWPDENFYLYFAGKILEDNNSLGYYEITNNSTIQYIERIQGGTLVIPSFPFNNMNTELERNFYKGLPLWRSLKHGFSLKGRCQNKNCAAYNDVIYINKGYGSFDIARECFTSRCPQCCQVSKNLLNCCFWCASYEWSGCLKNGQTKAGKGSVGHEKYITFKEGEYADWAYLEVFVKAFR